MQTHTEKGTGILEAIIVVSIISVAFAAILSAATFFVRGSLYINDETQAVFLLDETAEVVRFLRDDSFSLNIAPLVGVGPKYLEHTLTAWNTTSTNSLIFGKFSRSIEVSEVFRLNSDDTIVPSTSGDPKTVDTGTVRVLITVSWPTGTVQATTYVTDIYEN